LATKVQRRVEYLCLLHLTCILCYYLSLVDGEGRGRGRGRGRGDRGKGGRGRTFDRHSATGKTFVFRFSTMSPP
jgi:hypothetical protein